MQAVPLERKRNLERDSDEKRESTREREPGSQSAAMARESECELGENESRPYQGYAENQLRREEERRKRDPEPPVVVEELVLRGSKVTYLDNFKRYRDRGERDRYKSGQDELCPASRFLSQRRLSELFTNPLRRTEASQRPLFGLGLARSAFPLLCRES